MTNYSRPPNEIPEQNDSKQSLPSGPFAHLVKWIGAENQPRLHRISIFAGLGGGIVIAFVAAIWFYLGLRWGDSVIRQDRPLWIQGMYVGTMCAPTAALFSIAVFVPLLGLRRFLVIRSSQLLPESYLELCWSHCHWPC